MFSFEYLAPVSSDNGESRASTIALAIVIPLLVLIILGFAFWVYKRRKTNKHLEKQETRTLEEEFG